MLYKDTYRLKRLEKTDFPAVKELFWKVFKKKVSLQYLENKYDTSYLGIKYICSIAYCDDIPVAFYGAIPQKFSTNGNEIYIAHACDSYTLAEHQRKGLHYQLAKLAYKIMIENNIRYVYAFHSKNTYLSTKKLDWKEHEHLQRFHIKINTLPIAKVLNKFGWNGIYNSFFKKKLTQEAIKKLSANHKDKFRQVFKNEFVEYKNSFNNHNCIAIENCIFWFKIQAIMHIGMFYAPSEIALQKAVKKLKRKAFFLGITEFLFQVDQKSNSSKQLTTLVSPKDSWLVGYLSFDNSIELKDFIFNYSDLDTF